MYSNINLVVFMVRSPMLKTPTSPLMFPKIWEKLLYRTLFHFLAPMSPHPGNLVEHCLRVIKIRCQQMLSLYVGSHVSYYFFVSSCLYMWGHMFLMIFFFMLVGRRMWWFYPIRQYGKLNINVICFQHGSLYRIC